MRLPPVKTFTVTDLRQENVFPNLSYRFSTLKESSTNVVLERDFLGENPLHYYSDLYSNDLIVANNISTIKQALEQEGKPFTWERVRAVSNNTRTTIDDEAFHSTNPREEELGPTLREYENEDINDLIKTTQQGSSYLSAIGTITRLLLDASVRERLETIPEGINGKNLGLLLSGGLDSMSVGYLLSKATSRNTSSGQMSDVLAFTLKVREDEPDVVKSRELAKHFGMILVEVKVEMKEEVALITTRYDQKRNVIEETMISTGQTIDEIVAETLAISGNPKKDNVFCAVAMNLIARAVTERGIVTVFCGEGPNEMINDYGYNPRDHGYDTDDKGDVAFREALTFGTKKTDRQLGRGGLPKHAIARMEKIFAHHGLRLEAPYFDPRIARTLTRVPHSTSYDTIKQHIVGAMFQGEGIDHFIQGTSKEKFQDGSGISHILKEYDQQRLLNMFESIYGIKKTWYLR